MACEAGQTATCRVKDGKVYGRCQTPPKGMAGKLLQQAGEENDSAKKIVLLEQFLEKYGSHEAAPSVHFQLLAEYLKVNSFDKALEHGEKAQAVAPEDIEVAHLLVKAAEGKGAAPRLAAAVEMAHALAQKAVAVPKPSDEGEAEAWKQKVDFAAQVDLFNQHALYSTALKLTSPQDKVLLLDASRKLFPGGQYDKMLDAQYVVAYQQLGQADKMSMAAEGALASDPNNEAYLYLAGEGFLDPSKGNIEKSQNYAQKILDMLPGKAKPENVADADWAQHKDAYLGLAHSLLGRSLANQGQCAPAVKELSAASAALKSNNDALSQALFFLGFCSAKLEKSRDALKYFTEASKIPGPYQAQSAEMVKKIRAALRGQ